MFDPGREIVMSVASIDAVALPVSVPITEASAPPIEQPEVSWGSLKRFTVDEYHKLIQLGIINEDGGCELLKGLVFRKTGKNRRHSLVTRRIRELLEPLLNDFDCYVDSQEPLVALDSEPEPDVYVVRGKPEDYQNEQLAAKDVLLVIEVAETTLQHDRITKKWVYSEAGIPVYWIVNLVNRQIEIYTQPSGPAERPDFGDCQVVPESGEVAVVIEGKEVGRLKLSEIMP
jgi:Uma2 family endonuclease